MTRRDWIRLAGLLPLAVRAETGAPGITPENFAPERLRAAIFAETNRVRVAEGRRRLLPEPKLDEAAADQATTMAARLKPSHDGPFPGGANAFERVVRTGLKAELVAENVSAISLPAGNSDETWGDDYGQLAAVIVSEWMASPGHRRNLLRRDLTHLGCAARLALVPGGRRVFSVQVFCRPGGERKNPFAER